jgi:hypothetical protein
MVLREVFTEINFLCNIQKVLISLVVTLHYVTKACLGKTLQLIEPFASYEENKYCEYDTRKISLSIRQLPVLLALLIVST